MHWRYCCPECDSVQLIKRSIGGGNQLSDPTGYYCRRCGDHYTQRYDKKKDQLVSS